MKIAVGISGGVDSCVSAYLLKKEGHDVLGITMKIFDNEESNIMIENAKTVCNEVGIKHVVIDLTKEFKEKVIDNFIDNYKRGCTPNPCVVCNKYLKFGLLYDKAKEMGYDYIATGHYVDIHDNCLCKCNNDKDQSYFLYGINKDILSKIIFPLKKFNNKDEIRKIAKDNNFSVFNKKDSQEICFIPNDDYISFLNKYLKPKSGNIILKNGTIIGKHNGIYKYTIGQRKGLGIGYSEPLYVIDIDTINNNIIVGSNDDLFKKKLIAKDINILDNNIDGEYLGKIRSRGKLEKCYAHIENNELIVEFIEKQRAITKGQSVVLYKDNICVGGGIIDKIIE